MEVERRKIVHWNNNCNSYTCTGIKEFIATQEKIGDDLTFRHKIEEKEMYETEIPLILVYKCSKCNDITLKMNVGSNYELKKEVMKYYKHKTKKPFHILK